MNADVKLTGYDKQSDFLSVAFTVPTDVIDAARHIAGVPETDPDVLGVYPLTAQQAAEIADKAALPLDLSAFDYCLEAIAWDERPKVHVG
jgi:hypothetical protein